MLNFSFNAALLRFNNGDTRILQSQAYIDLYIGSQCIRSRIPFRVFINLINDSGIIGVEFLEPLGKYLTTYHRVNLDTLNAPALILSNPSNPEQEIPFRVLAFSSTGMHLLGKAHEGFPFPGMLLEQCRILADKREACQINIYIDKVRPGDEAGTIFLEVTVSGDRQKYQELLANAEPWLLEDRERLSQKSSDPHQHASTRSSRLNFEILTPSQMQVYHKDLHPAEVLRKHKVENLVKENLRSDRINNTLYICVYHHNKLLGIVDIRKRTSRSIARLLRIAEPDALNDPSKSFLHIRRLTIASKLSDPVTASQIIQTVHAIALSYKKSPLVFTSSPSSSHFTKLQRAGTLTSKESPFRQDDKVVFHTTREVIFQKGLEFNPFFWNEVTSAAKSYLSDNKLILPNPITATELSRRVIGSLTSGLAKVAKFLPSQHFGQKDKKVQPHSFIHANWTTQHYCAHVLVPYLLQAEEMVGKNAVRTILNKLGVPREYFLRQTNWVSVPFFDRFIEEFKQVGNVEILQLESGRKAMKKEVLGFTYYFLKHFFSVKALFQSLEKVVSRFNTTRTLEIVHFEDGHATVKVGCYDSSLLPKDPSSCLNWKGNIESIIELISNTPAKVSKLACSYKGDESCIYEIEWNDRKKFPNWQIFHLNWT